MARFRQARTAAKQKIRSAASWWWLNMTDTGRATAAYLRGEPKFDVRIRIDDGGYQRKVSAIEDIGWRLVERIELAPVEVETSTTRDDGSHEVTRTTTQQAEFHFVRSDEPSDE